MTTLIVKYMSGYTRKIKHCVDFTVDNWHIMYRQKDKLINFIDSDKVVKIEIIDENVQN